MITYLLIHIVHLHIPEVLKQIYQNTKNLYIEMTSVCQEIMWLVFHNRQIKQMGLNISFKWIKNNLFPYTKKNTATSKLNTTKKYIMFVLLKKCL